MVAFIYLSKKTPIFYKWGRMSPNDNVTVYNPYGYIENVTTKEFIDRTSFNAYKNMSLFLNFGFAFGAFHKNTVFYAQ